MESTPIQKSKTNGKYSKGLQSPDLLANHPLIGVVIFLLSVLVFGVLAYFVMQKGALVQWDKDIVNRMHETAVNSPAWLINIMAAATFIGLQGHIAIGILLGLYFIIKKFWKEFIMTAILFSGSGALWLIISKFFDRARPEFAKQLVAAINYKSFPSGHVISAVVCYTLLAYFLAPRMSSRFRKAVVIIFAALMLLYICFSRFFLGAHYLTDIAAGLAAGFALTSFVVLIIELSFKKGGQKHAKENETNTR